MLDVQHQRGVFQRPTAPHPLLSVYGIIYVTWYTSGLPEATGVRLQLTKTATPC